LTGLDFLVVQEAFHPTPTTELADLVLPAATWGENEGTYTNTERRVSKANIAVKPPGEAKTDFDIFLEVGQKLGLKDTLFPGWKKPSDAFNEWRKVSKGRLCDYSGITYQLLAQHHGIQWPFPEGSLGPEKTRRPYSDGNYQTPSEKAKLWCVDWEPFPAQPSHQFPFLPNTGESKILERLSPTAWLEMNPKDSRRLGLKPHDRVTVTSPRSRLKNLELRITQIVAPGQVFLLFHYAEKNSNELTQSALVTACSGLAFAVRFSEADEKAVARETAARLAATSETAAQPGMTPEAA
jgi:predicted molibdopterin-dependent oxidoreductase YjgC